MVKKVGTAVRGFLPGDRVVSTSSIGCGRCSYCTAGCHTRSDVANPNDPRAESLRSAFV